jgi:hypothetical protein
VPPAGAGLSRRRRPGSSGCSGLAVVERIPVRATETRMCCVRPPGLEPGRPSRSTATSRPRVYLIPPRAPGAAIRCRPGSSAVRRRSRSRARRQSLWQALPDGTVAAPAGPGVQPGRYLTSGLSSFRGWTRTSRGRVQSPAGTPVPHPEPCTPGGARTRKRPGLSWPAFQVSVIRAYAASDSNRDLTD